MGAKDFLKALARYCKAHECGECSLTGMCGDWWHCEIASVDTIVSEIEEWIEANPKKTRQDVFLERYPGAEINPYGVLALPPCYVDVKKRRASHDRMCGMACLDCQKDYWSQPADDDDKK